jgi:2-polyprenyl-6-methoxyphenol hydroxylase-like FAD-dependent oxidoreductase
MNTSSAECQVLVVGAGPTGLMLAARLLARGIDTRIVDKAARPALESRAVGVHARTLELLDTMGMADAFIDSGHRVRRFRMYAGARTLLKLDMARNGSPYGFILHLPQSETERLLRARVRELGGTIEQGVELVSLSDHGDVIHATLCDSAGRRTEVRADYVAGCDGAHSRVRHELDIPFGGRPYPQDWLLADVTVDGIGRDDEIHAFFRPDGLPLACLPLGGQRWRVVMSNAGNRGGRPPSLEEIRDLVEQRAPRRLELTDPGWLSCFRCSLRTATTYRRGRGLLAGDAAHIHSPAGGQGMNTGMMDAANLAWKLTLVAERHAADSLLDTYGHERLPVAADVLRLSDRIVRWSTMRHPIQRALRDVVVPAVTRLPAAQSRAARQLSQVSVAYPSSPLTQPDSTRRRPRPGERVPDVEVRTGAGCDRLYATLRGGRHVLLVSGVPVQIALDTADLDHYAGLVDVVSGGLDPHSVDAFALVRPDGILAARGSREDVHKVIDYLRQLSADGTPRQATPIAAAIDRPLQTGQAR